MISSGRMTATLAAVVASLLLPLQMVVVVVQSFPLMPATTGTVASSQQGNTRDSLLPRSMSKHEPDQHDSSPQGRRSFLWQTTTATATAAALVAGFPRTASAGIDLTSLGGSSGSAGSNSILQEQLKAYDGSGSARVNQIKASTTPTSTLSSPSSSSSSAVSSKTRGPTIPDTVATTAFRYTLNSARTSSASLLTTRYQDRLASVTGKAVPVEFEFPTDWLQLDRALGGIQYVDQRNGDKLYVFRVSLPAAPAATDTAADTPAPPPPPPPSLETVSKRFFGQAIFDPRGSFVQGGNDGVSDYKVKSSKVTATQSEGVTPRRRLGIQYTVVTGNGYSVERRALVDAYQVGTEVFMIMTSSNAVKFEAKGRERDTVEAIVDSFRIGDA
jgi:hypothetical protein